MAANKQTKCPPPLHASFLFPCYLFLVLVDDFIIITYRGTGTCINTTRYGTGEK